MLIGGAIKNTFQTLQNQEDLKLRSPAIAGLLNGCKSSMSSFFCMDFQASCGFFMYSV